MSSRMARLCLLTSLIFLYGVTPSFAQEKYIGEIFMVGFNFCPRGSTTADGQLLPISSYNALFSLFGTFYGGDGRTTFALPDLRGRVPLHAGSGPGLSTYTQGQSGGAETVTLSEAQLPAHTHSAVTDISGVTAGIRTVEDVPNTSSAAGAALAEAQVYNNQENFGTGSSLKEGSVVLGGTAATTVASAGEGQAVPVMQPYLTIRYCVQLQGIYPSRN